MWLCYAYIPALPETNHLFVLPKVRPTFISLLAEENNSLIYFQLKKTYLNNAYLIRFWSVACYM